MKYSSYVSTNVEIIVYIYRHKHDSADTARNSPAVDILIKLKKTLFRIILNKL